MPFAENKRKIIAVIVSIASGCLLAGWFFMQLRPASVAAGTKTILISPGDGFRDIAEHLEAAGIIRSATAFKLLAIFTGEAFKLKPGIYKLSPGSSGGEILSNLFSGSRLEVTVTVPEGSSKYEIDKILSAAGVIRRGSLARSTSSQGTEGRLFPDTYNFFTDSGMDEVLKKFAENFSKKAAPLFAQDNSRDEKHILILASLVEKEVPEPEDRRIVAGILEKRLKVGMPLQIDATICYVKAVSAYPADSDCYPLTPLDFRKDSPYNTYLYAGLPPDPIGNPGISAINSVLTAKSSPYWYYLSDPRTKKTIFSRTLDEQEQNRIKYLKS